MIIGENTCLSKLSCVQESVPTVQHFGVSSTVFEDSSAREHLGRFQGGIIVEDRDFRKLGLSGEFSKFLASQIVFSKIPPRESI